MNDFSRIIVFALLVLLLVVLAAKGPTFGVIGIPVFRVLAVVVIVVLLARKAGWRCCQVDDEE